MTAFDSYFRQQDNEKALQEFLVSMTTAVVRLSRQAGFEDTANDLLDAFRDWNNT